MYIYNSSIPNEGLPPDYLSITPLYLTKDYPLTIYLYSSIPNEGLPPDYISITPLYLTKDIEIQWKPIREGQSQYIIIYIPSNTVLSFTFFYSQVSSNFTQNRVDY